MRREYWGYLVWGVVGAVIAIPEIWAAVDSDGLPWRTISETVGSGLELDHPWVALVVVALIVFAVFSTVRYRPSAAPPPGVAPHAKLRHRELRRTAAGGRLTIKEGTLSDDDVGLLGAAYAGLATLIVIGATLITVEYSSGVAEQYHSSYVLYGLIALFGIVLPSIAAFVWAREAPFPTLFTTVARLEGRLGPLFGSLVAFVILAGLVILLLHLVLYPFPDITHQLNPNGG